MPLHAYLTKTLHGVVKPFITKCSLAAIESESQPSVISNQSPKPPRPVRPPYLPLPTELPLRRCTHNNSSENVVPEAECLLDLLSGGALSARSVNPESGKMAKNKEHFILTSADEVREQPAPSKKRKRGDEQENVDLRGLARQIPGVPVIYVKRSVMVLEELSGASLGVKRTTEREKIGRRRKSLAVTGDLNLEGDDEDDGEDKGSNDRRAEVVEEVPRPLKKKRKKGPKEPNPLSVKKKAVKLNMESNVPNGITARLREPVAMGTEGTRETRETGEKKSRKRKHKGGGSVSASRE